MSWLLRLQQGRIVRIMLLANAGWAASPPSSPAFSFMRHAFPEVLVIFHQVSSLPPVARCLTLVSFVHHVSGLLPSFSSCML